MHNALSNIFSNPKEFYMMFGPSDVQNNSTNIVPLKQKSLIDDMRNKNKPRS